MRTLRAMRLVAVSVVKNEADIIEAFVRHTLARTDHHLVFDHDSTDGTREILQALQAEGLPLTLFRDDAPGHLQQARSNHLTRLAAQQHGADWILPLDADEFLDGPGRSQLEAALQQAGSEQTASLPLLDYCASEQDRSAETNPVLRLRHCRPAPSITRKIFIPLALALDSTLAAGKGSHALYRGTEALPSRALPEDWQLAHFALRSPQQQVLRVVRAELQRLSRGRAAAGLDVHYRLGYQLLAEDPALFLQAATSPAGSLRERPFAYRGEPLRHTTPQDWSRVTRALLPYLEQLATSHGRMADETGFDIAPPAPGGLTIHEVTPTSPTADRARAGGFAGFTALSGWGPAEGPVPEAFLPQFHWGYAPATILAIDSPLPGNGRLSADLLTYSDNQTVTVELNGVSLHQLTFPRTNQRERLSVSLPLRAGRNELRLIYSQHLASPHDPRALATIFLSLRVTAPTTP
ncbi:MAG: hypothetical protein QG602_2083 [Verrucomicrobiota bacterium]|nr:hypothetical protein [Verrucomicrobiota bacterium]